MNVTIIGTGNMARGLGRRVLAGGHELTLLGKELADAEEAVGEIGNGSVKAGRSGDAIADEVVILAVYFPDAKAAVEQYGDGLSGKVVVDITNPVKRGPRGGPATRRSDCRRRRGRQGRRLQAGGGRRAAPGGCRAAGARP